MTDRRHRLTQLTASRRGLLTSAGAVAGAGLAGGFGLAHGLAGAPAASAATGTFTPIEPSGDTSGATDTNAIQSALTGEGSVAWLGAGTFYSTISFTASQQAIRGQGRRVTVIMAASGFTGTQTGTTTVTSGSTTTTVPTTAVIYTGASHQFLTVDGLTIQGPSIHASSSGACTATVTGTSFSIPAGTVTGVFVPAGSSLKVS